MKAAKLVGLVVATLIFSAVDSNVWARGYPGARLGGHHFGPARHAVGYARPWLHRPSLGYGVHHGYGHRSHAYHHYRPSYHYYRPSYHHYRPSYHYYQPHHRPYHHRYHYYRPSYYHQGYRHHGYYSSRYFGVSYWPSQPFTYFIGGDYNWYPTYYSYGYSLPYCYYPVTETVFERIDIRLTGTGEGHLRPEGLVDHRAAELGEVPLMLDKRVLTSAIPAWMPEDGKGGVSLAVAGRAAEGRFDRAATGVKRDDPPLVLTSARLSVAAPVKSETDAVRARRLDNPLFASGASVSADGIRAETRSPRVLAGLDAETVPGRLRHLEAMPDDASGDGSDLSTSFAELGEAGAAQLRGLELMLDLGDRLFRQGQYRQAANQYRSAITIAPQHPLAHLRHAYALVAMGHHAEAAHSLRQSLLLDPQLDRSGFRSQMLYSEATRAAETRGVAGSKRADEHLEELAGAALRDPGNADLLLLIGAWLHFDGESSRAQKFLQESAKLSAEHAQLVRQWQAG